MPNNADLNELLDRLIDLFETAQSDDDFTRARDARHEFNTILDEFYDSENIEELARPKLTSEIKRRLQKRLSNYE